MDKRIVFLSGPMRGIPRSEGLAWRIMADRLLHDKFLVLHAYRGREDRETFTDPRGAIARDMNDIHRSDIIIVNDTFENATMIGTAMEVFSAHQQGKIIIIFGTAHEKDYFLNYFCHIRTNTLEEACSIVNTMYSG